MASQTGRTSSPSTDEPSNKRSRTETPKVTEVNKPYQSEHADITLVSSDGYPFKVHSYHLKSASPVFRAMLEVADCSASSPEVKMTDDDIDRSDVIRIFLDVVHGRPLEEPMADDEYDHMTYEPVIAFLQKYEAAAAHEVVRLSLISWARHGKFHQLWLFIYGTMLDDVELCKAAIVSPGRQKWSDYRMEHDYPYITSRNVMDLSAAPVSFMAKIPDRYRCALLQASATATPRYCVWAKADKIDPRQFEDDKQAVAVKFEALLQTMRSQP
ncbi:hypothetical protein IAU59_002756 [Kwoniella sp. CBS 9459]